MNAGALDHLATFRRPVQSRDADGGLIQGWQDVFRAWVAVKYLRGGETVMQARMASRTPAILTFRVSAQAREVTSEWRVAVAGRVFDVKEDPRLTEDRAMLAALAEAGGASGT